MALMRLAVAEVQRFPMLADHGQPTARQLSTEMAARFLGEMAQYRRVRNAAAFA